MPVWGWVLLIAGLSALMVGALFAVVWGTHRLRTRRPLHGNVEDIAAPLPLDVAEADGPTAREHEIENNGRASRVP
jgi:hypothetical protein